MDKGIEEIIIRIRKHRHALRVDDPITGHAESTELIERTWYINADQPIDGEIRAGLYEAPKIDPTLEELTTELHHALLAKLRIEIVPEASWTDDNPYTKEKAIAELQREARGVYRNGHLPHEQREHKKLPLFEQKRIEPAVSHEALRVENNLTPKQRFEMHNKGLQTTEARPRRAGRQRSEERSEAEIKSTAPYNRARVNQRPKVNATLRAAMRDLVDWVNKPPKDNLLARQHAEKLASLETRYSVVDLPETDSKYVAVSRGGRLAAAVAAADSQSRDAHEVFKPDHGMALLALKLLGPKY